MSLHRTGDDMTRLIQHMGRLRGMSWAPTDIAGELARRCDYILREGIGSEQHREIYEYRKSLPGPLPNIVPLEAGKAVQS